MSERSITASQALALADGLYRAADDRSNKVPAMYGPPESRGAPAESPGAAFVGSQVYRDLTTRFREAGLPRNFMSDPAIIPGGFRALVSAADAVAGSLARPDYRGILEGGLVRPLMLRDLVTVIPVTETGSVEYSREVSRVSAAAPVAEATALTGTSGTKPEGG